MPRPESAARGSPRASRIARVAAFALAVLACLPGAGASAAAEPTFDDVTLRGFTTLERVFDATADLAGKGGEYGARVRGQLCILVDPEVGLFSELRSIEGASRRLFARLGGGTSVHVRAYGAPAASAARDESELRRLLEARVGSVSDPIDVLAEVRRTIALMEEAATPKTLLLIGRRGVSGAAKIAETIAAARAASVRVVVAAPEAIFALPPQDTMNAGILYPRAAPPGWAPSTAPGAGCGPTST